MKKQRRLFSFAEDERICLAVIAALQSGSRIAIPVLGASWFQKSVVDTGLLHGRTGQSIYQRFKTKLQSFLSDALARANVSSKEVLKVLVLERLLELHGLVEEVEFIQVELAPIVLEF